MESIVFIAIPVFLFSPWRCSSKADSSENNITAKSGVPYFFSGSKRGINGLFKGGLQHSVSVSICCLSFSHLLVFGSIDGDRFYFSASVAGYLQTYDLQILNLVGLLIQCNVVKKIGTNWN